MLQNALLYNAGERGEVERELELAIPTLVQVGLFELFDVDEWIVGHNPDRSYVGALAKRYLQRSKGAA